MSRGYSIEEIKAAALRLRKKLGFENTEYLDMRAALAATERLFPGFRFRQVKNNEIVDAEGKYDPITGVLRIPDRVFQALDRGVPRARFSIAHELAHPVLGHDEIRYRHAQKKAYEKAKPNIAREEREAEEFAAFFLAPDHLCEGCVTVEDFIERFGLSRRAAEIRKKDYDQHLRRLAGEDRPLTPTVIDYLRDQKNKGYKVTTLKDQPPQINGSKTQQSPVDAMPPVAIDDETSRGTPDAELCPNCGCLSLIRNGLLAECKCGYREQL
jgi:hypothetical protein